MSNDAQALAAEPESEDEYQAFHTVLAATARGRAFLDEHARRRRHADTEMLLAALKRLENQVAGQGSHTASPVPPPKSVPEEVAAVLETVRSARAEIDAVRLAGAVTQLVSALDAVQRKLSALVASPPAAAGPVADPQPVKAPFTLAITAVAAQALAKVEPDEEPVRVFKAGEIPPPAPFTGDDFASDDGDLKVQELDSAVVDTDDEPPQATSAAVFDAVDDALAPVMALSEEERLALFT
jgi:hypothetical protein